MMIEANRVVVGKTLRVSEGQVENYPEMKEHLEKMMHSHFSHSHPGATIQSMEWRFEPRHTSTDPETGEEFWIPAEWMLIAEGWA